MITTNGAKIITYNKIIVTNTPSMTKTDGTTVEYLTGGSASYAFKRCSWKNTDDATTSSRYDGMVMNLGVGSAEPSASDYWLDETEISGTDINTIITCSYPGSDTWNAAILDNGNIAFTYVFRNTGSDAITVTEIGISYVCSAGKYLVGRKLIAPRTIQPGETVTFTYELAYA